MMIGNIELKNNLILAPMAGVSDVGFRSLCVEAGADFAETEMVSAKALMYNNEKTLDLLNTAENEKIKVVQLFGHEPEVFAEAVKHKALEKFDIIDINMGCPAPKIVSNGDGSALMKDIDLSERIIRACVQNSKVPIIVKFRMGWDLNHVNAIEFAKMCERAGASAITIHGRVREQFFSGNVDLKIIKDVKNAVRIPVIANGDVFDKASYLRLLKTGCDAVMIGRGAMGNPQIFSDILGVKRKYSTLECIEKHIEILRKFYPENLIAKEMKKHLLWYLKGERNVKAVKQKLVLLDNLEDMLNCLKMEVFVG